MVINFVVTGRTPRLRISTVILSALPYLGRPALHVPDSEVVGCRKAGLILVHGVQARRID